MSDILTGQLAVLKLRQHIARLEANLAGYRYEVLETDQRKAAAFENIKSTECEIEKAKKNLEEAVQAHGDPVIELPTESRE